MTPEAQRIAIAEVCGYSVFEWAGGLCLYADEFRCGDKVWFHQIVPDYLTDLNAMHEAEKILTHEQRADYTWQLANICTAGSLNDIISATASQRAEAFLKTLNLWDDTK